MVKLRVKPFPVDPHKAVERPQEVPIAPKPVAEDGASSLMELDEVAQPPQPAGETSIFYDSRQEGEGATSGLEEDVMRKRSAEPTTSAPSSKRSLADTSTLAAPLSRAKRQRTSVKFSSPAKAKTSGTATSNPRRAAAAAAAKSVGAAAAAVAAAAQDDSLITNNDFCESCGGKGHFLCCDGCPRSFHFACLDPPLELDEIPAEAWYCNVCLALQTLPIPGKGIFGPLIRHVEASNPKCFVLTNSIKNSFKHITTGSYGEYIDTTEFRPFSAVSKGKGVEEREPYKLKDKAGKTVLCHRCKGSAEAATQKRIAACDFCELHWHLDCVEPPLVGMPPITRKWMCPIHAESTAPRQKTLKHPKLIKIKDPSIKNNGDIDIVADPSRHFGARHPAEELISQGLRYQVPEQVVILDFWSKTARDKYGRPLTTKNLKKASGGSHASELDFSDASSLTSMDSSPDDDDILPYTAPEPKAVNGVKPASNGLLDLLQSSAMLDETEQNGAVHSEREGTAGTAISDGDPPDLAIWASHVPNGHTDGSAAAESGTHAMPSEPDGSVMSDGDPLGYGNAEGEEEEAVEMQDAELLMTAADAHGEPNKTTEETEVPSLVNGTAEETTASADSTDQSATDADPLPQDTPASEPTPAAVSSDSAAAISKPGHDDPPQSKLVQAVHMEEPASAAPSDMDTAESPPTLSPPASPAPLTLQQSQTEPPVVPSANSMSPLTPWSALWTNPSALEDMPIPGL